MRLRLAASKCAAQRVGLLVRKLGQVVEERPRELEESRELELGLVLDPESPNDGHPFGPLGGVLEQCRLADSGLASNDERAATPPPSAPEQFVDARAVGLPTDEHVPNGSQTA
jgi:hypothetical protein